MSRSGILKAMAMTILGATVIAGFVEPVSNLIPDPTMTPTPTFTATFTATATGTSTSTNTPFVPPTPTMTFTPTMTLTPTITITNTPAPTSTPRPTIKPTQKPTKVPVVIVPTSKPAQNCDASYPDVCIAPYPPDLDCGQIPFKRFRVVGPDPHGFDRDHDGIGCES